LAGVDEKTLFQMTEALGLGMGGMEGTCGAVTAACVLAGLKQSSGNTESPDSMKASLRLSKEIVAQFLEKNGTIVCKELKGTETGKVIRSCPDCITDTVEILEKVLYAET
jgi:C_GCAxxG_C_C family probable redox protein